MYQDKQTLLSDAQALTATADSTNYIDLGSDRDVGRGNPLAFVVTVDVAADFTTGDEVYTLQLETDDNTSFSSSTIIAGQAVLAAALTAGSRHVFPLGHTNERYLQGVYTLAGTTPTVTLTASVMPLADVSSEDVVYANGYTIV